MAANSTVQGPISLNFEQNRDFMGVVIACGNEVDPIKNEGARVVTALFIDFSDAQRQLTLKSETESSKIKTHPSFYGWSIYQQE